jgi:hypothetical protein
MGFKRSTEECPPHRWQELREQHLFNVFPPFLQKILCCFSLSRITDGMGLGTESEKRRSGLGGPAHALAQTGGRGSELRGGEGDRHARTRAEKRSGEKGRWRGGGHGHGQGAWGRRHCSCSNSLATTSTASSVSFGHVRCGHGPIVYENFPVPKRRRTGGVKPQALVHRKKK